MNHETVIEAWIQAGRTVLNAIEPPFSENNGKIVAKIGNMLRAIEVR